MPMKSEDWDSVSQALLQNPSDLNLWQSLIHCAEAQDGLINRTSNHVEVTKLRETYEAFLAKFPLLMKYWTAYALWERNLSCNERAELIFQRALKVGLHDINLWITYLKFKIETLTDNVDDLLCLFELARTKIGFHYHGFEFYQIYLQFLNTYTDSKNKYREKAILLMRMILEIPLYNFAAAFEIISQDISPTTRKISELAFFMGSSDATTSKSQAKTDQTSIREKMRRFLNDSYVAVQSKSFNLFYFERLIMNTSHDIKDSSVSTNDVEAWGNYLTYLESTYSFEYVIQAYERCMLNVGNHQSIAMRFADYCISKGRVSMATNVLRRSISLDDPAASEEIMIRLIDLDVGTGNIMAARDFIRKYISLNNKVSYQVFEKLMQVEALLHSGDDDYICSLAHEILALTKNVSLFVTLSSFPISKSELRNFFLSYVKSPLSASHEKVAVSMNLASNELFWESLQRFTSKSDLEGVRVPPEFTISRDRQITT